MGAAKWIRFAVLAAFAGLFFWLFYARYWMRRDCAEAQNANCITPAADNLIGGGAFWIVPALLFALLALIIAARK